MGIIKIITTNIEQFRKYLIDKDLSDASVSTYMQVANLFLKRSLDINNELSIRDFLINKSHNQKQLDDDGRKRNAVRGSVAKFALIHLHNFTNQNNKGKEFLGNIKVKVPKVKTKRKYLNRAERIELINHMPEEKNQIVALVQLMSGCRIGDILKMRKVDDRGSPNIFFEKDANGKRYLKLYLEGKGAKNYPITIKNEVVIKLISDYLNLEETPVKIDYLSKDLKLVEDFYFLEQGSHESKNEYSLYKRNYMSYWRDLKIALKACGHNDTNVFSTHDFRRCVARDVWDKTKDIDKLKTALNHSDVSTSMRYLKGSGQSREDILDEVYG